MEVIFVLLAISLILFFGFFAGFIFKKFGLPDVLFLIILGFVLGPTVLGYVSVDQIAVIAPVFTTFTLLFLLFDGAFNINLSSLVREFSESFVLTLFNFAISSIVVFGVMFSLGYPALVSILTGFLLGGVSSSFVIPILQQMKISEKVYSLLALESALTDVFCIVFSLTVIEIIRIGTFALQDTITQLITLFAVAGLIGLLAGVLWIFLILHVFKEHNYMMAIAYLILLYVLTEFFGGNGAIASLFFGLMLKNSKQLIEMFKGLSSSEGKSKKKKAKKSDASLSVTTPSEQYFYHQISFFLKTFFFVYIGLLIDLSDTRALFIGIGISFLLALSRTGSTLLTKNKEPEDVPLINSIFARGLAAAAVAQVAIAGGVPYADLLAKISYVVITGTIILSSIRIFLLRYKIRMPFNL